jgi:hypothetical protein
MKTIPKRFLSDPDWYQVEELVLEFINPLLDLKTIDTTQPAEHVKAEVIARGMSYEALIGFVRSSGILRSDKLTENKQSIFR